MRSLRFIAGGAAVLTGLAGCGLSGSSDAVPDVVIDMQAASSGEPLFSVDAAADFLRVVDFNKSATELRNGVDGDVSFEVPEREKLSSRRWGINVVAATRWNPAQCQAVDAAEGCAAVSWKAERNGVEITGDAVMSFDDGLATVGVADFCEVVTAAAGTCRSGK